MKRIRDPMLTQQLTLPKAPDILDQHPFFTDWFAGIVRTEEANGKVVRGEVEWIQLGEPGTVSQGQDFAGQDNPRCTQAFRIEAP